MKFKSIKKNSGFALLFSVMISSLLLTIGLSIFSITLKELAISTAARESIHAFFAADSGRECAIYWDVKAGKIPTFTDNTDYDITCGGVYLSLENSQGSTIINSNIGTSTAPLSIPDSQANYYVNIKKTLVDDNIITTVTSFGHDSDNDDRVERAIEQTY